MHQRKSNQSKIASKGPSVEEEDFFNEFSDTDDKRPPVALETEELDKKPDAAVQQSKTMMTRIKTGFSIFGCFVLVIGLGHFYCALLVLVLQIGIFREIIGLKRSYKRERPIYLTTVVIWYIFFVGTAYILLTTLEDRLYLSPSESMQFVLQYKSITAFSLYMLGFLAFVLSIRIGYIRYQVRLFLVTHIVLMLSMAVSGAIALIYQGLIWFLTAAIIVILNDCGAYHFGIVFGKTRLIALSPKKTVEGFLGGFVTSLLLTRFVC